MCRAFLQLWRVPSYWGSVDQELIFAGTEDVLKYNGVFSLDAVDNGKVSGTSWKARAQRVVREVTRHSASEGEQISPPLTVASRHSSACRQKYRHLRAHRSRKPNCFQLGLTFTPLPQNQTAQLPIRRQGRYLRVRICKPRRSGTV